MTASTLTGPPPAPTHARYTRPRLRADLLYRTVSGPEGEVTLAFGEGRHLLIEQPCAVALVDLLDGRRSLLQLADAVAPDFTVLQVTAALRRLAALNLLVDGPISDAAAAAAWDARGVDPAAVTDPQIRLVLDQSNADLDLALAAASVTATSEAGATELAVVTSLLDPRLAAVNAQALATGRDWWLIRPVGNVLMVGPHFRPHETGCWECLRQRLAENQQVENFVLAQRPTEMRPDPARAQLPSALLMLASVLATELRTAAVTGSSPVLTGALLAVDTRTWTTSRHPLTRQPQCPACGEVQLGRRTPGPDLLASDQSEPAVLVDGGLRMESAEATLARLESLVDPYLGVVSSVTRQQPDAGALTFSYGAGHNFALPSNPTHLRRNLRGQSGGKGRTDVQARVSAIGEAVERYSGVWRADRPVRLATRTELGPDAVDIAELTQFSPAQYANRRQSNASGTLFHRVPEPLSADTAIDWTPAWSLTEQRLRWVPAGYCFYGHPDVSRHQLCVTDSNGCAAGTTVAEAVLQGFCELVERDSVALWWYHRSRMPGVDLAAFDDPWITALIRHYRDVLGRDLWCLDLTADLGVPTFAAVSRRRGGSTEDVIVGFGAHLDAAVALGRALTELNQFLPSVALTRVSRGGRPGYAIDDPETVHWLTTVRVADQPWLTSDPAQPVTGPGTYPAAAAADLAESVSRCVTTAAAAGLQVLVVDQRRPDIDLAVVKVIVPGLRHFWRRLGPGRLWEVPVALGRWPRAVDESQINPYSVFF